MSSDDPAVAAAGALPPPVPLDLNASTTDAFARQQTLTYRAKLARGGVLTHIVMSVPTDTNFGRLRSSSGTVAPYRRNQIIWRPSTPLSLAAGARLVIPVSGLTWRRGGTFPLWLTASTAEGKVLTYATGTLQLVDRGTACAESWGNTYIEEENAKPGTPGWQIEPSRFDPANLAAFCGKDSYACGEIIYLRIHATSLWVSAEVFRLGYYGGVGARLIWATDGRVLAGPQPASVIVQGRVASQPQQMVDASSWSLTLGIRVDGSFPPGTYLIKISDREGRSTYVPFTVRDDTGTTHALLLQQATTTWQAYNKYGGRSFYTVPGSASLSFNRPYLEGQGSGQYLSLEYGLVYWLEKNNYDVGYWTDMDLHFRPEEVATRTKTIILPSHDEYYSPNMRDGLLTAVTEGVNLVSFGANQIFRQIRPNSIGSQFEVYERWSEWPYSTTWRHRGFEYHEQAILGAEYGCPCNGSVTTDDTSWLWAGIAPGTMLTGFINGENDWLHPDAPIPPGTEILHTGTLDFCKISSEPNRMDIVAHTDVESGARVFGGSTFAYSPFLIASVPTNWRVGVPQRPLEVSDIDAEAVGQVVANVLSWTSTGEVDPLGAATVTAPFVAPVGGIVAQEIEQDTALAADD